MRHFESAIIILIVAALCVPLLRLKVPQLFEPTALPIVTTLR